MKVYLDNGATSFPKPKAVENAIIRSLTQFGGSLHRSQSDDALDLEREVYKTRLLLADFFGFKAVDHVVFTKNITESINLVLNGFLNQDDHVLITGLEHNAVIRPLEYLKETRGISYDIVQWSLENGIDSETLQRHLAKKPKLMIATAASNVTGDIVDLEQIGQMCHEHQVPLLVDTAQAAGVVAVDFTRVKATFLAFTGHKSLMGPTGIGGLLIDPAYSKVLKPFILGGTGSLSEHVEQPSNMPDKFESGTQNILGILGLKAAIETLNALGLETVRSHELTLVEHLQRGLGALSGVSIVGNKDAYKRTGIVSIKVEDAEHSMIVHELNKRYGITVRGGIHCAPLAHKTYGTYPKGTIRLSVSRFNTVDEIDYTIDSMEKSIKKIKVGGNI